ncbi:MAG: ferrous iron transport protein A [Ignavibacteria bacterium]|nr:ferrous iron transport protein A [Ignavibacteria bacterium]
MQHLDKLNITIGTTIKVLSRSDFDQSMEVEIDQQELVFISKEVAQHIFVQRT